VTPEKPERADGEGLDGRPPQPGERYTPLVILGLSDLIMNWHRSSVEARVAFGLRGESGPGR